MEWSPESLQTLSNCFHDTLSPSPDPRRKAEANLSDASDTPGFALAVLRLVAEPTVSDPVRIAAAVHFKNHLKSRWPPSSVAVISDEEKSLIRSLIVSLMLSSPPKIQSQLSEALAVIGNHDFPKSWPSLLPDLTSRLRDATAAADYSTVKGILGTVNSLFKKFRYQFKTTDLLLDLKYCLDIFAQPLLETFLKTASLIDPASPNNLSPLFESQRLCCRIFFSLNFLDLPEYFEDHMEEWMGEFSKYLTTTYPALESSPEGLALADELRSAVCENINLYMEKNEEEFKRFLSGFASAVWRLLETVSLSPSRDQLAVTAIKFLTTVSTSVHHSLFQAEGVISQVCQSIVIPNVRLREDDEELFDMNYVEFIRRDMEGSDLDTRRRIACELLKGIATNNKAQVTELISIQIRTLLSSYASNPATNWKDKDCAIYLVVSLATKKAGGTSVSTDLVDVGNFFKSMIIPELQSLDVNAAPMLKAGALKFFTMFRNHIPKQVVVQLFPNLIRFLGAESNVVHSYAAICIEKLFLVKDEGGRARYGPADIAPVLLSLMNSLFVAFRFPESEENQYVMKCVMRVLGAADITREIAAPCIDQLTSILCVVCKNPRNPVFNHYLFESVAVLVKRACERDYSLTSAFEAKLFPCIQTILGQDVSEFFPYALQLLAQLLELNRPPIPETYTGVFQMLLLPDSWKRSSNVPALVRLLQAFLQKAPDQLKKEENLIPVLGIFTRLLSSKTSFEQGFFVLNTVIENVDYGAIAPHTRGIWTALLNELQNRESIRRIKSVLISMSLFLVKHGAVNLIDSMNAVQLNIFQAILARFWIPYLKDITGPIETKLTAVASTRLLCESPSLLDPSATEHWGKLLDSVITLLSRPEEDRVEEEPEMPDIAENVGYSASFVQLFNAGKKEDDPVEDVKDPKEFLVVSLARLCAQYPHRFPQVIDQYLEPVNKQALGFFCTKYNCQII